MRISLKTADHAWPGEPDSLRHELTRVARAADDVGLDTVRVADHLLQVGPQSSLDAEVPEAYTTLGFLAARTTRVRLGTMVTGVTFRPPGLLVKAVTALDVLAEHCTAAGRPREEIETTLGIEHTVVITEGPWTEQGVAAPARAVDALGGDPV
ncbi:hypothetical protein HNR06_000804 [Nocardiopsis arvandica]|uniref:Luciferase-like domain-containing protein n=1 Tax=Nocardiopsis sinuspersici TaxID=501010 RepID=A0A7Y9XBH7_9ACTN|nr:hypothetical protein [Nocardiopsis sinuspersici]